ncbi:MAG: SHOCT domain-containing protein [Chloroflexota bacterium]|nr:SHOCT domain-containing protein [Chloroflexota bacterium]
MGEFVTTVISLLALVAVPIVAVWAVIKWLRLGFAFLSAAVRVGVHEGMAGTAKRSTPLEILEERYARGEIDHAEFEERRRHLLTQP